MTRRLAPLLRALAAAAVLIALASCSQSADDGELPGQTDGAATPGAEEGGPAAGPHSDGDTTGGDADPDVDYDNDAGADLVVHEYPDDPEPAEESAGTLCNLTGSYIQSLRTTNDDGVPVVDDDLRLSVLTMSDNLLLWESMQSHFPEYADAIADAQRVHDLWDEALLNTENGDETAAEEAMLAAESVLEELPEGDVSDAISCD